MICGGQYMDATEYWKIFMETGLPEAYMLYCKAKKVEASNVSDNKSTGAAGNRLQ
jgi:hypothetical protein